MTKIIITKESKGKHFFKVGEEGELYQQHGEDWEVTVNGRNQVLNPDEFKIIN